MNIRNLIDFNDMSLEEWEELCRNLQTGSHVFLIR